VVVDWLVGATLFGGLTPFSTPSYSSPAILRSRLEAQLAHAAEIIHHPSFIIHPLSFIIRCGLGRFQLCVDPWGERETRVRRPRKRSEGVCLIAPEKQRGCSSRAQ